MVNDPARNHEVEGLIPGGGGCIGLRMWLLVVGALGGGCTGLRMWVGSLALLNGLRLWHGQKLWQKLQKRLGS